MSLRFHAAAGEGRRAREQTRCLAVLSAKEQTAARPKNARPLQSPLPRQDDFVAAVPSRVLRDGTGIFMVKVSHYLRLAFISGGENNVERGNSRLG